MRHSLLIFVVIFIVFGVCAVAQAETAPPADAWAPFRFLVGNWTGVGSGQPGEGVGTTSFAFDLGHNILVRKSKVEFPPKPGEKTGPLHEDLMIVYAQLTDSTYRAIYFDNEGHVINYRVAFPEKQPSVVFESEGDDKTPRFRLTYEPGPNGLLASEFAIASPGGSFRTYIKGTARRSE